MLLRSTIDNSMEISKMDWVPIVFGAFKLVVLGVAMFFAIKWHYDKDKELKEKKREEEMMANETSGPASQ